MGYTKKKAAQEIGLELRTYEGLEDGVTIPLSDTLLKACEYYKIPVTLNDIVTLVPRDLIETLFDSFR